MAKKKSKLSKADSQRVKEYLDLFSNESAHIRQELANTLPAYNLLLGLNLHSVTFEEIRLRSVAKEKGLPAEDPFFDVSTVRPPCPGCGEKDSIRLGGPGQYICNKCNKKYAANWGSISWKSNLPLIIWARFLYSLLKSYSIKDTLFYCGIAANTYYKLLQRVAYGMDIFLEENLRLYGKIQTDITFFRLSYKGVDQYDSTEEFPEDSIFDDKIDYIPRKARSRGGHIKMDERSSNYVAVVSLIDEFDHIYNKYVNIGSVSATSLKRAIGDSVLLPEVPTKDPFPFPKLSQGHTSSPGQNSVIITDGESAIKAFAMQIGMDCESHVYRKDGKQLRLPRGSHNIQKVNSIHSRLKDRLRKGVSSAYLPAYLSVFNFFVNIPEGKEEKAIHSLLEILTRPGLGKSEQYYKDRYTPPNLWKQWSEENNPLKKLNENQLTAIYLFHLRKEEIKKGVPVQEVSVLVKDISKKTQFTEGHIRRLYKNAVSSNLLVHVIAYFEGQKEPVADGDLSIQPAKKKRTSKVTPELLAIYDEYAEHRSKPFTERVSTEVFIKEMNTKYGTNLKRENFLHWCNVIAESGLRPPLPKQKKVSVEERMDEYLALLDEYEAIRSELINKNIKTPLTKEIYEILSQRHGLNYVPLHNRIVLARKERQKQMTLNGSD